MTYILIALVGASFIFEYWLLTKIGKLDEKNKMLQKALEALGRDTNNFQAGSTRDSHLQKKELLIEIKRINKKVDVVKRDIMNSLPTQIRKVIGHIEFAQPLDNSNGRG
jgi:hypothetical protein